MNMLRSLVPFLVLVVLGAACSVANAPDDPIDSDDAGGGGVGLAGPGPGGGGSGASGGSGGFGGSCDDTQRPSVTSSNALIPLLASEVTYTLTFDEEVTIENGGITITGGATVTSVPALPGTGSSFELSITGLDLAEIYDLTVSAAAVTDGCGNALEANFVVPLGEGCANDVDSPIVTSPTLVTLGANDTTASYMLTFDEPVTMAAGAIALDSGTGAITVTPSLPATAASFVIDVTGMSGATALRIDPTLVGDVCFNALAEEQFVELCPGGTGGSVTFTYTGSIVQWEVPACVGSPLQIEARGAQGGTGSGSTATAGLGARMRGDFALQRGDVLKILVGQSPGSVNHGGGGSFVTTLANMPLVVAGGGGGGGTIDNTQKHGRITTSGGNGGNGGGFGGSSGNGGSVSGCTHNSAAGAGLNSNGQNGNFSSSPLSGGVSFVSGGSGGGAFGGAGTGSGSYVGAGGGGYSGGGGGCGATSSTGGVGGGGGSFNSGSNQSNSAGVHTGAGQVTITWN